MESSHCRAKRSCRWENEYWHQGMLDLPYTCKHTLLAEGATYDHSFQCCRAICLYSDMLISAGPYAPAGGRITTGASNCSSFAAPTFHGTCKHAVQAVLTNWEHLPLQVEENFCRVTWKCSRRWEIEHWLQKLRQLSLHLHEHTPNRAEQDKTDGLMLCREPCIHNGFFRKKMQQRKCSSRGCQAAAIFICNKSPLRFYGWWLTVL